VPVAADTLTRILTALDTPFWHKWEFWIALAIGLGGLIFSWMAFVQASQQTVDGLIFGPQRMLESLGTQHLRGLHPRRHEGPASVRSGSSGNSHGSDDLESPPSTIPQLRPPVLRQSRTWWLRAFKPSPTRSYVAIASTLGCRLSRRTRKANKREVKKYGKAKTID
jgi:hypothetical protein